MLQHFFIEGKYLGTAERKLFSGPGPVQEVYGYSFCCPRCGKLWAQCPAEGQEFHFLTHECRQCGKPTTVLTPPGSIYLSWDSAFIEAFPDAVLRWEIERYLDNHERLSHE